MTIHQYVKGIRSQDYGVLGKAITLIESSLEKDKKKASQLIEKCIPFSGKSIRIGVSGTPGVGKSTFIESLGTYLSKKNKIAVLAIDPSSTISKGSILGDKTRMLKLANSKSAFIRPSPNKGQLGGVSCHTKETIILCEAAGFNIIFIETVGVGQSESEVASMTDFFIYLTLIQNGDQLQFIKKGVLELSDIIIINKCDQNKKKCQQVGLMLKTALQYSTDKKKQEVFQCSALLNTNIQKVWQYLEKLYVEKKENGTLKKNRQKQNFFWLQKAIENEIKELIFEKTSKFKKRIDTFKTNPPENSKKVALKILKEIFTKDF